MIWYKFLRQVTAGATALPLLLFVVARHGILPPSVDNYVDVAAICMIITFLPFSVPRQEVSDSMGYYFFGAALSSMALLLIITATIRFAAQLMPYFFIVLFVYAGFIFGVGTLAYYIEYFIFSRRHKPTPH